jgi:SAM-dependent methyltransferase
MKSSIVRRLKPKFSKLAAVRAAPQRILDIGIANDSYLECKLVFPTAAYDGIDSWMQDLKMINGDRFFIRNLEDEDSLSDLGPIYDVIIVNHVIEHLKRGQDVFSELCRLLVPGGYMYVEFPSLRTAHQRKRRGSYHFHDDPTHRRFYLLEDLANSAIESNCQIVSCGPASTWLKDVLSVPRAAVSALRGREWGPYLLHFQRKIDHILVQRRLATE